MTAIETLKQWFSNLKKPTQEQFWAWLDSFWHKSEKIPMASVEGLDKLVEGTASAEQLSNHLNDTQAHKVLFDKKVDKEDGKGLSANDFTNEYKQKLDTLHPTDTSGLLPKGGYEGTGKELKDAIDNLQTKMGQVETTLSVDDTDFDTLQEIATQVKSNKNLETLLTKKVDKEDGKGLSSNDFTTPLKNKLESLGFFQERKPLLNFGVGDEIKKYYLTESYPDGEIDITALPNGSAVEIYNFKSVPKRIKVDKFFGDPPIIGARGSKVLLKKLNDGTVFIEQFDKDIIVEPFSKTDFSNYYIKTEFNKEVEISFQMSGYENFYYVAVPLKDIQTDDKNICFSFEKEPITLKKESNLSSQLSLLAIVLSQDIEGTDNMNKFTLNYPLNSLNSRMTIELPSEEKSIYMIKYALLCYSIKGYISNFEEGGGYVSVVFNAPIISTKNIYKF
ncbi:hypothetical protein [Capnocytophaga sp. oral taxon 323]|uniref:hypothetical protein n=1 Tax=Capnocytophaga sp. oral taxon 323 TaxID=1705617 RepID=UPI000A62AF34|nr:hypothetical protein [Capnocytophaga sp. oral taxon 323]